MNYDLDKDLRDLGYCWHSVHSGRGFQTGDGVDIHIRWFHIGKLRIITGIKLFTSQNVFTIEFLSTEFLGMKREEPDYYDNEPKC